MNSHDLPPAWISELTHPNFLALYDVTLDIREVLQLTDEPQIPASPLTVKFGLLLPENGTDVREHYFRLRKKSLAFLQKQGIIHSFELNYGKGQWDREWRIKLDGEQFKKLATTLDQEYEKRSTSPEAVTGSPSQKLALAKLESTLKRFHSCAVQLASTRHNGRSTLYIKDEYDVQDLLHALLYLQFDDVREEEWTPSYAAKAARVDFLLKRERIVIEVKKTRSTLGAKEIADQLIIDINRYSRMGECDILVNFVYDPEFRITNPDGFESDLSYNHNGMTVKTLVIPK